MSLPTFRSIRNRQFNNPRNGVILPEKSSDSQDGDTNTSSFTEPESGFYVPSRSRTAQQRDRHRRNTTVASFVLFFLAFMFLIIVEIGSLSDKPGLRDLYFVRLDLTNIFPLSVPNAVLINSIARSLGLHDFYNVALWNFCEGYNSEGITFCSTPKAMFYFNPVQTLISELLNGATISLPSEITTILYLIKLASNLMFAFFLTGILLCFFSTFLVLLPLTSFVASGYTFSPSKPRTCIPSFLIELFAFSAALLTTVATVIATVMFVIFKNVITSQEDLDIGAELGKPMFGVMWAASACALAAWVCQIGLCCGAWGRGCCAEVRKPKKMRGRACCGLGSGRRKRAVEGEDVGSPRGR